MGGTHPRPVVGMDLLLPPMVAGPGVVVLFLLLHGAARPCSTTASAHAHQGGHHLLPTWDEAHRRRKEAR